MIILCQHYHKKLSFCRHFCNFFIMLILSHFYVSLLCLFLHFQTIYYLTSALCILLTVLISFEGRKNNSEKLSKLYPITKPYLHLKRRLVVGSIFHCQLQQSNGNQFWRIWVDIQLVFLTVRRTVSFIVTKLENPGSKT